MMENDESGDIILILFPFSDAAGVKRRPALIISDCGDEDVIVARISSRSAQGVFDVELSDWRLSGLLFPSTVRINKLATLQKRLIERRLGKLTEKDRVRVHDAMQEICSAI